MFSLYVTEYITPLECALIDWSYFECKSQKHCMSWSRSGCICLFIIISWSWLWITAPTWLKHIDFMEFVYAILYRIWYTVLWCFITKSKFMRMPRFLIFISCLKSLNFQNNSVGTEEYFQSFLNLKNSNET